ncbi:MAG: PIG-L family deacetylase [Actinobacteria bacterium]|nr:PIG-L family deacetylase [Actinomycetota bacterium]
MYMSQKLAWLLRFIAIGAIAGVGVFVLSNLLAYKVSWVGFQRAGVKPLPSIPPGSSVVVLAPHPDDETLSLGGWLASAAAKGATVRAILLTNGDAFTLETAQTLKRFEVKPADYIRNGELRQIESLRATRALGYASDLQFLGFPDRGTAEIWRNNWLTPFKSPFTQVDRSPYKRSFKPGALYEGRIIGNELAELFARYQPDFVIMPNRLETHPDHYAANLFGTMALTDPAITKKPVVVEYIVHRGGYPFPYGFHPYAFLPPPEKLLNVGLDWRSVILDSLAKSKKARALVQYRSQFFFASYDIAGFYRRNEVGSLGGGIFKVETVPESMVENGEIKNPELLEVGAQDPVGDRAVRLLEPAGDVTMLRVVKANESFVIATFNAPASGSIKYRIDIRAIMDGKLVNQMIFNFPGRNRQVKRVGKSIEVLLPPGFVSNETMTFVEVITTSTTGGEIDRSAGFFKERE